MGYARKVASQFNIAPQKKLGQNFLIDESVCADVVAASDVEGFDVIEIGAGTGNMTKILLESHAKSVTAIELDKRCIEALSLLQKKHGNLQVLNLDAVKFDEASLGQNLKVVSNLPYNVGTVLLIKWLHNIHLFSSITIMLQREVVDRIVASPGDSNYGFLSVISQFQCYVEKLFAVPAESFWPVPKVTSSVLQLVPLKNITLKCSLPQLEHILKAAFSQKRKMIRNNLKNVLGEKLEQILGAMNIKDTARAEELTVAQFCELAHLTHNLSSKRTDAL